MRAVAFHDPLEFAPLAQALMARQPAAYNVPATVLAERTVPGQPGRRSLPDELWLLVLDGDAPVAAAMHIPPFTLFVGPVEGDTGSAAAALVATLAGRPLPGVTGERAFATAFARAWQRTTGGTASVRMAEVMYDIEAPPSAPPVPGSVRQATEADLRLLDHWLGDFHAEATPDEPWPGGEDIVRRRLGGRALLFWEHDGPVSLAGVTRPAEGVARIGPVYTPPERRGHGYASALTAAGVAHAFAAGASRVALYADLANATSNGVYRRLGFRPIGEALLYTFKP